MQLFGQRLFCSASMRGALMQRLEQERVSRETWTGKQWGRVVQVVAQEDWGAVSHGGSGKARPVFDMKLSQASQGAYTLMLGASPGRSALWLCTTKKIEVPGKGFVFLG